LTFAGRCGGRIIANPARSTQYAARIPKAIDPIDAQTSISKSIIVSAYLKCIRSRFASRFGANPQEKQTKSIVEIVAEVWVALTPNSIDQ
jgi:hypothetical protein